MTSEELPCFVPTPLLTPFWGCQMSISSPVLNPATTQVATRVRWTTFFLMLMLVSINYTKLR